MTENPDTAAGNSKPNAAAPVMTMDANMDASQHQQQDKLHDAQQQQQRRASDAADEHLLVHIDRMTSNLEWQASRKPGLVTLSHHVPPTTSLPKPQYPSSSKPQAQSCSTAVKQEPAAAAPLPPLPTPQPAKQAGPTLDEVYKSIMAQKHKAEEASRSPSLLKASLPVIPASSLAPIASLDQELSTTHLDIDNTFSSRVFRSSTMEEFDALIGANDDLLFDLIGDLPADQQQLIEELQAEGGEQAQPQKVKALIRTLTLDKIFGDPAQGTTNGDAKQHHPSMLGHSKLRGNRALTQQAAHDSPASAWVHDPEESCKRQRLLEAPEPGAASAAAGVGGAAAPQGSSYTTHRAAGAAPAGEGQLPGSFSSRVFRSSTMEEFDALLDSNDDLLFDLVGGLPLDQQQLIEELQAEGGEQAQPQKVKALIRTLTLDKIFGDPHPKHRQKRLSAAVHGGGGGAVQAAGGPYSGVIKDEGGRSSLGPGPGPGPGLMGQQAAQQLLDLGNVTAPAPTCQSRLHSPHPGQGQGQEGAMGQAQPSQEDTKQLASQLRGRAEALAARNGSVQSCLDLLLRHLERLQRDNQAMKLRMLQYAADRGFSAQMEHLDQTIAVHRPPEVPDEHAIALAARFLAKNNGSVESTVQQLVATAMSRSQAGPAASPSPSASQQQHQHQHQHQHQRQQQQQLAQQLAQQQQQQLMQEQQIRQVIGGVRNRNALSMTGATLIRHDSLERSLQQLSGALTRHDSIGRALQQVPGVLVQRDYYDRGFPLQQQQQQQVVFSPPMQLSFEPPGLLPPGRGGPGFNQQLGGAQWQQQAGPGGPPLRRQPSLLLSLQRQASLSALQDAMGGVGVTLGMPMRMIQLGQQNTLGALSGAQLMQAAHAQLRDQGGR